MNISKKRVFIKMLPYVVIVLAPFLYFPIIAVGGIVGPLLNVTFQVEPFSMEGLLGSTLFIFLGIALIWVTLHYIKRESKRPYVMSLVEIGSNAVSYPLAALLFGKLQDELFWPLYALLIAWPLLEFLLKYPILRWISPGIRAFVSDKRAKAKAARRFDCLVSVIAGAALFLSILTYYICWLSDNKWITTAGVILSGYLLASVYVHIRAASPLRFLTGVIGLIPGLVFTVVCIYRISTPLNEVNAGEWIAAVALFWIISGFVLFELFCSLAELAWKQSQQAPPAISSPRASAER